MAILHGSWLTQHQFVIWAETWRRVAPEDCTPSPFAIAPHPFALSASELQTWLQSSQIPESVQMALAEVETVAIAPLQLALPTLIEFPAPAPKSKRKKKPKIVCTPLYSIASSEEVDPPTSPLEKGGWGDLHQPDKNAKCYITLHPWHIEALCLTAAQTLPFLQSLPLGLLDSQPAWLGADLRFWSHISRWSLDLLARCKFLPTLKTGAEGSSIAQWQPLLDSQSDRQRLSQFSRLMPGSCHTYQPADDRLKLDFPTAPKTLLWDFLSHILNAEIQTQETPLPNVKGAIAQWLQSLTGSGKPLSPTPEIEKLKTTLTEWMAPIQQVHQGSAFSTILKLHPPQGKSQDWLLEYGLQSVENPDCVVDANTIWNNPVESLVYQGYTVYHPQETFLAGLGLASRIFPPLEESLNTSQPLFCRLNPQHAYELLKTGVGRLRDSGLGVILPPSLAPEQGFSNRLGLSLVADTPKHKKSDRLSLQSLLQFKWELTLGGQRVSKKEFDQLVALDSPLVEINGEWVELRPQDVRVAQEFFTKRKDQMSLSLEDALRISTGDTQMVEKLPVVDFQASERLGELLTRLMEPRTIEAIAPPETFKGQLRPYQSRGVGWLAFLEQWGLGACLADDMGLGKTIQFLAFLLVLKQQKKLKKPTLLVCPTSVLGNWQREAKRFAPSLQMVLHHGDKRVKNKQFLKAVEGKDLVITSYPLVFRDQKDLQAVEWQGVVLDEAQNIKNPQAKQSQAVRELTSEFRIALTGTPVENRLQELWSIMDFLNPGYLGNRQFFQRRFTIPIEKYGDRQSLQTLRSLSQPFILRRLKTDRTIIEDLPEKQEMTVFCALSHEQKHLYQDAVEKALAEIEQAQGIQRHGEVLALLTKLKQICNHPEQFLKKRKLKQPENSGKLMRLRDMLEEVIDVGDRALIFTQFSEWGKLLKPYLEQEFQSEVFFLYGSTKRAQREEMIDRFQHDPQGPKLFILSLKAGGVGLNLTRANHVFHFDRWWNPAVENQATDRVFRIGQTRNVQVHKFVCEGTLEEKINDLIASKQELAEQVVGSGENWLANLDSNQLRDLLLLEQSEN
ncbi:DEAD/DEAH box helicase [Roseofilum sp. BLCC_M91]|uniref:DEAD/DEAH box helicase n=1 Tax=Roseofilum halophilum BLCC-M91 TaxID=3022259 RepID=A0ABT7BIQ5_9CYAN|nr:DEAD/DEAH box helicase [Roseofilum halophilum]MDJ1179050.1 DEAD/DEAH box helicase [Roseofilum halophilum BLCC-M91]